MEIKKGLSDWRGPGIFLAISDQALRSGEVGKGDMKITARIAPWRAMILICFTWFRMMDAVIVCKYTESLDEWFHPWVNGQLFRLIGFRVKPSIIWRESLLAGRRSLSNYFISTSATRFRVRDTR